MKRSFGFVLLMALTMCCTGNVLAYEDVSPQEAYDMATGEENAYILDVRTPAEWVWVGHPGENTRGEGVELQGKVMHIPWQLWTFDPKTKKYAMEQNKFFSEEVVRRFQPGDTIITICRSGQRSVDCALEMEEPDSVRAAKRLEELGYYGIYNMKTGFEGGKDVFGYRTKNCWKVDGLPYNNSAEGIWNPIPQGGRSLVE